MNKDLQRTYDILNTGAPAPAWFHTLAEWLEIYAIVPLQIERDADNVLQVFAAVLDAGYVPSGEHTYDGNDDDMYFEEMHEETKR